MSSPGNIQLKSYTGPDDIGAIIDKFTISKPVALSGELNIWRCETGL